MGGTIGTGKSNDDLVDNLVKSEYIKTKSVEGVFRAVDRAFYVLPVDRIAAYKNIAWRNGNLHLSAPCVYSEVMESLSLKPGLSFLNIGSGTGYLSTMAGLILTHQGINHGIELREDCLNYAYSKLEEFKQNSLALNHYDFCEPVFVQGNCFNFASSRLYDRVYCGAECPENKEQFIKRFVKIGGILVMPFQDFLVRMERIDESNWSLNALSPVSFVSLVVPATVDDNLLQLPQCNPLSLDEICRYTIRQCIQRNVHSEYGMFETQKSLSMKRKTPDSPGPDSPNEASNPVNKSRDIFDREIHRHDFITTMYQLVENLESTREEMEMQEEDQNDDEEWSDDVNSDDANSDDEAITDDEDLVRQLIMVSEDTTSADESSEKTQYAYYIDFKLLNTRMLESINQLPLPHSLKVYINYNRELCDFDEKVNTNDE